ncbi:structural protein [Providencia stuartii]|uniref:structural protein n=1 Tax=Providencia stuartii TaxID=588 RepID=UPI0028C258E7|nr:structural protein [Providencia stuartii]MDT7048332.1 structural protein [Providencia stuartii]
MTKQARGIRNNNPGNIDYNKANNWKGQLPHDPSIEPRFCRFESPVYGIRALMALLRTYQRKYGLKTVSGLINRWAPTNENNTSAYINGVAKELGVSATDIVSLDDKPTAIKLAKAIIRHENGTQPYDEAMFEKAWGLL